MEFKIGFHHGRRGKLRYSHPVFIHPSVYMDNTDDITICGGVSISRNVRIYTHDHYHDSKTIEDDVKTNRIKTFPLLIFPDVYIGDGAIILAGVKSIGKGAVIGAGSVVTRSVPAYEIWCGNPAELKGYRKTE